MGTSTPSPHSDPVCDLIAAVHRTRHTLHGPDPVLTTLTDLAEQRDLINQKIRALLAYARHAVHPRPYRLAELASALGMSISGVRISYRDQDIALVHRALQS